MHVHTALARTYGLLELDEQADIRAIAHELRAARVDEPALVVLEITPDHGHRLGPLLGALGGSGKPAGIVEAIPCGRSLVLELDETKSPLSLVLDLVDIELQTAPGRRIVPLLPLSDRTLATLARDLLVDPALDITRIIETYTEPMLYPSRS
ncbi:MAG TPA: hypothetical protein VGD50_08050 [Candidatus Baltobacteraceae bacterium]